MEGIGLVVWLIVLGVMWKEGAKGLAVALGVLTIIVGAAVGK